MKAIGMYIFGGSQTIGHMLEGWDVDTILEMTDDMLDINAYHFHKNYPDINMLLPKEYISNESILTELKNKNYDLLFANPPCSGLSTINRNASADCGINIHIYEVINMVNTIEPKTFLIENAPTLTTRGLSILKNLINRIGDKYYFTIINDVAKNHNTPMYRRRTFVVGFNKKYFKQMPVINQDVSIYPIKDVLKNIEYKYNAEFDKNTNKELFKYYKYVNNNESLYMGLIRNDIYDLPEYIRKPVDRIRTKLKNNENIWDKSNYRFSLELAPSLTSLTRLIHPTENRDLYIREYAAIMGYPNDFIFYPDCKTFAVQCIAQGVPVNFIRYISRQIMNSFNSTDFIDGEVLYINQTNKDNIKSKIYNSHREFYDTTSII